MRYFGGKTRSCKAIQEIINKNIINNKFLSPFVGGGWVEQYITADYKILNDKHPYLMAMYSHIQGGWVPPTTLTREEYNYIKENLDETPQLSGFVGFGCSFAGKWFGGYANDSTGRNYCLNAYNSLKRKLGNGLLQGEKVIIKSEDYRNLTPKGFTIYCDPPYYNTTQYDKSLLGEFNTEEFWEVMRKWTVDNIVFVSEYNAPEDFIEVWSQDVKTDMNNKQGKKIPRIEKLYVHESIINNINR